MKLIKAKTDYYGEPNYFEIFINTNYIISMEHIEEHKAITSGKDIDEHYIVNVDFGNRVEKLHISLEIGNKLLKQEELVEGLDL